MLQSSRVLVLGGHYAGLKLALTSCSYWICNCSRPLFVLFLRRRRILVFINHIWILLYDCYSSIVALLHVRLLFLVLGGNMVIVIGSCVGAAADGVLGSTHFALVLSWINLIKLFLMHLLGRLHFCYCIIAILGIF